MVKMNVRQLVSLVLASVSIAQVPVACAQVIVSFSSTAIAAVPISPAAAVFIAMLVLLIGLAFLRKKHGGGINFLALALVSWGATVMYPGDGYAYDVPSNPYPLVTSPTAVPEKNYVADFQGQQCGPIGYVWVASGGGGSINLTKIEFDGANGYAAFDPGTNGFATFPAAYSANALPGTYSGPAGVPVCTVNTGLTKTNSCVVWYQKMSMVC